MFIYVPDKVIRNRSSLGNGGYSGIFALITAETLRRRDNAKTNSAALRLCG
jgi:hypothetical protein